MATRRKTPVQLQVLEELYSEQQYPTQKSIEECAASLGLTLKQVRGWFIEKRRRYKRDDGTVEPLNSSKKLPISQGCSRMKTKASNKILKRRDASLCKTMKSTDPSSLRYKSSSMLETITDRRRKKSILLQDMFTPGYILKKIFRKEGPPLGVEFDCLHSKVFSPRKDSGSSQPVDKVKERATKRRKVSDTAIQDHHNSNEKRAPAKRHGIGKGLMTVWKAVNPNGGEFPSGVDFSSEEINDIPELSPVASKRLLPRRKSQRQLVSILKQKRLEKKLREKKKPFIKRREVELNKKDKCDKEAGRAKCELALDEVIPKERLTQIAMLVDDEELEMRELHEGKNPQNCFDHIASSELHGFSLCKDILAEFPPNSVKMKQPFDMQPWDSSPEYVKKLFKVFHFLYTYSEKLGVCPFTLDEFAQAFHDKDSFLLGDIHVSLLKLLLLDIESELCGGLLPHLSVSCKFLALLHSVQNQELVFEFWKKSLNPLTWTEILRQVLFAAGFGSIKGALRREALSKEMNLMARYGLRPGTLKGEVFRILSEQGTNGMNVSELANCSQIDDLNLASSAEELESLIASTLSSDITLFEKISSSAYRLRINSLVKGSNDLRSDTDDSGSVDDDSSDDDGSCYSGDDSDRDSEHFSLRKFRHKKSHVSKNHMLTVYTEIDESHPGESWLLGLMEGEYSDLSIEEKLKAMEALIDLLSAGDTIRMKDRTTVAVECVSNIHRHGSGAKIKRAPQNQQHAFPMPSWVHAGQLNEVIVSSESHPVDSSSVSLFGGTNKSTNHEVGIHVHPMQSIFLGSDRRYNRYWLFLGPCNAYDPGHKRVYFESSEDGHWEVIDTEEALRALLSILDDRGTREAFLIDSLEKREEALYHAMSNSGGYDVGVKQVRHSDSSDVLVREDSSSPVSDIDNSINLNEIINNSLPQRGAITLEVGKKGEEQNRKWRRLQDFDAWIWNCFYLNLNAVRHSKKSYLDSLARCESCHDLYWRDEKHCKICHMTFELDFDLEERYAIHLATCRKKEDDNMFPKHKVLSSQLQSLKAAVHAIESVMPNEALVGAWTKCAHKLWVKRLRRTSSLSELLQVISDFINAINKDWLWKFIHDEGSSALMIDIITCFPSIPQTSSAVALWLVKLDDLIAPYLQKAQSQGNQAIRPKKSGRRAQKL